MSPELQGVEISITEKGAAAPLITVATNEMGAYRYENPKKKNPDSFCGFVKRKKSAINIYLTVHQCN